MCERQIRRAVGEHKDNTEINLRGIKKGLQEVALRLKLLLARLKNDVRERLDRENSMFAKPEAKESRGVGKRSATARL